MSEAVTNNNSLGVQHRRPLNEQQVRTLHCLYWYRFCTSRQIAWFLKKSSHKAIQNKLQILEQQELIAKCYDSSYKLTGRSAEYFITPKGARTLEKAKPGKTNQRVTKSLYRNNSVSNGYLLQCIHIVDAAISLLRMYTDTSTRKLYVKYFITGYDHYPAWVPDLHLEILGTSDAPNRHYFIDIWDGSRPFFVTVRKTRNYWKFKETDDWREDQQFPAILAVCENTQTQKKLNRQMKRLLGEADDDELVFATTTTQQLAETQKLTDEIWCRIGSNAGPEQCSLEGILRTPT